LAATYAIEQHGTQEHSYDASEFVARFDEAFPEYRSAISVAALQCPAELATRTVSIPAPDDDVPPR
jgi:hypothetical protein